MHTRAIFLALATGLMGCGGGGSASPEGRYEVDLEATADAAVPVLAASGRIPEGAEDLARGQLRQLKMTIDLLPGGVFECRMGLGGEIHDYSGHWSAVGDRIRIQQTHEDGEEKTDTLTGSLSGDHLHLTHDEEGMQMPYILRRAAAATPR